MYKILLITVREIKERIGSGSFLFMSIFGPLVILLIIYSLFKFAGEGKEHWNVLIADPTGIMNNKILAREDKSVTYSFADNYVELEEFRDAKRFQKFDAMIEVNEKVLSNKTAFVFFREKPAVRMQTRLQFQVERRIEEVMIDRFTKLSVTEFRKIKQPLNVAFRNVYDPMDESSDLRGWVGFFFGALIFCFVFLFGMTILRSITREKSNRIVEVLLASAKPRHLLLGKILGIGISAFIQFALWSVIVGAGLYLMRETLFPDTLDPANLNFVQFTEEIKNQSRLDQLYSNTEYNEFVSLVYERVQPLNMLGFFILFFMGGYLFYGAVFAALGSASGSENDGQQFVIPVVLMLIFSLYAGYFCQINPDNPLSSLYLYLPFTSPVAVMVKLAQGYEPGETYSIWISLIILLASSMITLNLASKIYKNGILQFGHRLKFSILLKWLKKI